MKATTFARVDPSTAKVSKSIVSVLQYFKWSHITVLIEKAERNWEETKDSLLHMAKEHSIAIQFTKEFNGSSFKRDNEMNEIMKSTIKRTRGNAYY